MTTKTNSISLSDFKKAPKGKCPECGSKNLNVYLLADYNSTVDSLYQEGHVEWYYSDAFTDYYCTECDEEFKKVVDIEE